MARQFFALLIVIWIPMSAWPLDKCQWALTLTENGTAEAPLEFAKEVLTFEEFIKTKREWVGTYVLGVDNLNKTVEILRGLFRFIHWADGYRNARLSPLRFNAESQFHYLSFLVKNELPVVFFVPPQVTAHSGYTSNEWTWLMAEPETRLKNVTLVFGAYTVFPKELVERFINTGSTREAAALLDCLRDKNKTCN